ncbi:MAG: hypothetical protein VKI81_06850 [Synechococcaceae cyanobacterium]|nr:hypothetical protein [Synechococcaceae cyanobacterium]
MNARLLKGSALALILLPITLGHGGAALAQQKPAPRTASTEEVNTYMTMSAINMCALAASKVPFKAAIDSSVAMVASVITDKHGSQISGAPAKLTRQQIINATVAETVLRVERICGKNLPAAWKKELDPLVAQVKKAMDSARTTAPRK